jgi:hypothetical protein
VPDPVNPVVPVVAEDEDAPPFEELHIDVWDKLPRQGGPKRKSKRQGKGCNGRFKGKARKSHGSFDVKGSSPRPGQTVWTLVEKASGETGELKQAKGRVEVVVDGVVEIYLTKTKRSVTSTLDVVFDHVPHLIDGEWL